MVAACSGSKHSHKDSLGFVPRVYHNTTARYNGYYYAKMKLHTLTASLVESNKLDYTKLLPLSLSEPKSGSTVSADLDSVITKLAVVLKLHPVSKWSDDCYYLMGKAYYYKNDFKSALATFQYVSSNFKDEPDNNKKKNSNSTNKKKKTHSKKHYGSAAQIKEKNKPQKDKPKEEVVQLPWEKPKQGINFKFLKHQPVRNQSIVWLVKSYVALGKYQEAASIITVLDDDKTFPWKLRDDVQLELCDLYLKQNRFAQAIDPLQKVIALTKNKKDKTRYTYILAQLYSLTNKNKEAANAYKQVIQLKPNYEMAFYAKINLAKSIEDLPDANTAEVLQLLRDILKDDKYTDFYDQVYYAIANIYLKQNNQNEGIANLNKSIDASTVNTNQKGLSFLKLAEINYTAELYRNSKADYDSTAKFIDKSNTKLSEIQGRKKVLGKLIEQLDIIAREDSLQKLSGLDEKDRNKLLQDMVSKLEKEKAQQDSLKQENNSSLTTSDNQSQNNNQNSVGGWYFYNVNAKSTGYNDFIKTWGNRKLEDDWRRSNKKSEDDGQDYSDAGTDTSATVIVKKYDGVPTVDDLLKDIPLTPEAMKASNDRIMNAWFKAGTIYQNDISNLPKAAEAFEQMMKLFPDNELTPQVYYSLYLIYDALSNEVKRDNYKKLLTTNYPLSVYAKILSNPNYLKEQEEKQNEVNVFYASTFDIFNQKKYDVVLQRIHQADSLYKPNPIQIKFDYLSTLTVGYTQDHPTFKNALNIFVAKYKTGDEVDQAKAILALLDSETKPTSLVTDSLKAPQKTYVYNPANPQFVVLLFSDFGNPVKTVVDSISNYNTKYHSLQNYKVNPMLFDASRQMIVIKQMKNVEEAVNYYNEIDSKESFFAHLDGISYSIFVIDDKNWQLLYKQKDIETYLQFFNANYQ